MKPDVDFCLALHRANASLQLKLDDELGTYHGIGFNDLALLNLLAQASQGRMKVSELVQPLGQPPSAVLRQLIVLEKIGLVERVGTAGSRQATLRPAGRARVNEARETADRVCAEAVGCIDPGTVASINAVMAACMQTPARCA